MFDQDYFMRQIKQFIDALERVLFKKKEGNQQEMLEIIEQSLKELTEENDKDFHELSLEETIASLDNDGTFNAELAFIVAELLYEQAELADKSKSKKCYLQSLLLYKKALKYPDAAFPIEAIQKVSQIENELGPSELNQINRIL